MGVQEMTRFGMREEDFAQLAEYMKEIILKDRPLSKEVSQFRKQFTKMRFCLSTAEAASMVERLLEAIQ
jgi:glycine/serine hydroxymethyltransferase